MARKAKVTEVAVDSIKHQETRKNIPTEELRGFVAEEEGAPKMVKYPRDPSLDPQLVWKGKDEQDSKDLEVPSVPIYIQEKIHPQALIEDLIRQQKKMKNQPETKQASLDLFSDFNGLPPGFDNKVDFYHHEGHWSNRMILGDSLLVMTSLAEKEGLKGKVQMVFIDPPYGIKFGSNWQVSTRKRDVKDGNNDGASRDPEQVKAFRDTWELGIHSYLSYLRDRFISARELLSQSGSVFIQIGMENAHLVRSIVDEVFGPENFISLISFAKTSGFDSKDIARSCDYLLWVAKDRDQLKARRLFVPVSKSDGDGGYRWVRNWKGTSRSMSVDEMQNQRAIPEGHRSYNPDNLISQGKSTDNQSFSYHGKDYLPGLNNHWKANYPHGMRRLDFANRIHISSNSIRYVRYSTDFPLRSINNIWMDTLTGQYTEEKTYVVQTSSKVIERCILLSTDPGDLVLDPTCGSGTTAFVAEQWGRRWITIDTSRVALALARTRLMSARYPYYLLADSSEGRAMASVRFGNDSSTSQPTGDVRRGFVYEKVPHVTIKSIANNEDIDKVIKKWAIELEPLRTNIQRVSGAAYEEWEIPLETQGEDELSELLKRWWGIRRKRQDEIDNIIARHAEMETLYDAPFEESNRVRVSGPFTVESLSPHRVLPADDDLDGKVDDEESKPFEDFTSMILENLRKAGIQNSKRKEKINFESLEPYAGRWIQAIGTYIDVEHRQRKVGISIGPEFGTVSPHQVKEAAKEAVQGLGFDLLAICGFAFDPYVSEEAKTFGRLDVVPVKMNPDLAMGNELLKKTGSGNLFMIYGEPDLKIEKAAGMMTIEVLGLDIYDPTTGQTRASSIDEIACWFIDTEYDGESFFVRHAYFTGGSDPYEKLKKTLRTEIDEAAWSSLYSAKSRPFPISSTGKVAVKVINHYGDEVVKIVDIVPR